MVNNDRDDKLVIEGVVLESNKAVFKVQSDDGHIIVARLSGKMRLNDIKVIINDRVVCEVSPYDTSLGRIVKRYK